MTKDGHLTALQTEEPVLTDDLEVTVSEQIISTDKFEEQVVQALQNFQTTDRIEVSTSKGSNCIDDCGEEQDNFQTEGCKCTVFDGKPCSSLFSYKYILTSRLNCMDMTRKELDLIILGQLSACCNTKEHVATSGVCH